MRLHLLPIVAALSLSACAPRALFFHESTKVAFAADYNTSDTQPLATSFGYKRRIVAVVPAQERDVPEGGSERTATNRGEALSLVSKFNVRVGTSEGIVITNNFASGMAARNMTRSVGAPEAVSVLMHSAAISVVPETGETTAEGRPGADVVTERVARIMAKRTKDVPASRRSIDLGADGPGERLPEVPPSRRRVDLDENGNLLTPPPAAPGGKKPGAGVKKPELPASGRSVDLAPDGEIEIKKR